MNRFNNIDELFRQDWIDSMDNFAFSLRTIDPCGEDLLHFHKVREDSYAVDMVTYPYIDEKPSLFQVLKEWFTFNPKVHKKNVVSSFNKEQMIALRDWIDEMLYDPEFRKEENYVE